MLWTVNFIPDDVGLPGGMLEYVKDGKNMNFLILNYLREYIINIYIKV